MGGTDATSLLALAEHAWASGDLDTAARFFARADEQADHDGDLPVRIAAVLGLARGQRYNLSPGTLPVRLHVLYETVDDPAQRIRLAAALARCWAYSNEPRRARPFALEALQVAEQLDDPWLLADALDAALASHWGPDDVARRREWATRLDDVAVYLSDPDARLQAQLWALTVGWEVLDLPKMHRSMRAIELLAEESARAEFFAASRRLPLDLLRGRDPDLATLRRRAVHAAERTSIPDAEAVLHAMHGYGSFFTGDAAGCAAEAPEYDFYATELGVITVRAEAAVIWLGAGRLDKVAEMVAAFTDDVLAGLPRDSDWLLILQCVLEGALAVADTEVVSAVLPLLTPYQGRSVVNAGAVMWHGVTDDTLARGYRLLGRDEAALRHRSAALATYRRLGAGWWRDRLLTEFPLEEAGQPPRATVVHLQEQPAGLWLVGRQGATFMLPRMRGLLHLHTLLSRPGTPVTAVDLTGAMVDQAPLEVLDRESRRFVRARLAELDAELAEGEQPALRRERDAIASYLSGAAGLGGRARTTGSPAERARVAVRKAIVAATARIAEIDPWLGRRLRDRVRTGLECRYEPDPDDPIEWVL